MTNISTNMVFTFPCFFKAKLGQLHDLDNNCEDNTTKKKIETVKIN